MLNHLREHVLRGKRARNGAIWTQAGQRTSLSQEMREEEEEAEGQTESWEKALRLTLSFRLKPRQRAATKTFLTGWGNEMFTVKGSGVGWGVGTDKPGHTRCSRALVGTVTVCYSSEQQHFLRRAVRNGDLGAPHLLTYPIWRFHFSQELSDELFGVFLCL